MQTIKQAFDSLNARQLGFIRAVVATLFVMAFLFWITIGNVTPAHALDSATAASVYGGEIIPPTEPSSEAVPNPVLVGIQRVFAFLMWLVAAIALGVALALALPWLVSLLGRSSDAGNSKHIKKILWALGASAAFGIGGIALYNNIIGLVGNLFFPA